MTTSAQLDQRYGRARGTGRRRLFVVVVAIVAVLAVGTLSWVTITSTIDNVRADGTSMQVLDDRTVEVGFEVSGPVDREIACALEALDPEFGIVGWKVIVLPPAPQHTRAFVERITTVSTATTGLVNSCWVT